MLGMMTLKSRSLERTIAHHLITACGWLFVYRSTCISEHFKHRRKKESGINSFDVKTWFYIVVSVSYWVSCCMLMCIISMNITFLNHVVCFTRAKCQPF